MAHLALYRKWRPQTFDEIVEQEHAVHALRQSVINKQIAHAYLFSGTRGTGKTTTAKIFSRAINCLDPQDGNPCNACAICRGALDGSLMDIIEMDAASNNSVDHIRRLCDEIVFMPSQARYKVYIIDEVHMLSTGAFNALLKTLEEPPDHAVFILATTEPHRIPATILSRCQHYVFHRISVDSMVKRLRDIANQAGIDIKEDALKTAAMLADGALRDAISIMDQAHSAFPSPITRDNLLSLAGVVRDQFLHAVVVALIQARVLDLLQLVDQIVMDGRDLARFITDLAQYVRNLLVCRVSDDDTLLIRVNDAVHNEMKQLAHQVTQDRLIALIRGLSALHSDLRWATDGRTTLEIGLIRLSEAGSEQSDVREKEKKTHNPEDKQITPNQAAPHNSGKKAGEAHPAVQIIGKNSTPSQKTATESKDEYFSSEIKTNKSAGKVSGVLPAKNEIRQDGQNKKENELDAEQSKKTDEPDGQHNTIDTPDEGAATEDSKALWGKILACLQEQGHMTLFLFARPACPVIRDGRLVLVFSDTDTIHYQEVSRPESLKLIQDTAKQCDEKDWLIETAMENNIEKEIQKEPSEDWVQKIRSVAERHGIPVKMEE